MTIATLGPSVRLVVFQFLMKNSFVPATIPQKSESRSLPRVPVSGKEVLASTPKMGVSPLADRIACKDYELVDAWQKSHPTNWQMSFVRFVFCHKDYIKREELFPGFVAKAAELEKIFRNLVSDNLWATQGHLNPYLEKDGTDTGHQVLMLGCAGRTPNTEVFSGGRDENNRGIGPKVRLSTISDCLMMDDNKVILTAPETVPAPVG